MDESFNPCSDFYQYSCRGWIVEHAAELKKEKANSTTVLSELDKQNTKFVTKLIEGIRTRYGAEGKAKRFYSSCNNNPNLMLIMDILMSIVNSNSSTSTRPESEALDRIGNSEDINTWGWMFKDLLEPQFPFFDNDVKQLSFLVGQKRSNPQVCTTLTRELFPEVVAKLFALHHYDIDQDESVTDLTSKIWRTFKSKMVYSTDWIDGINSKLNISISIGSLDTIVGFLGHIMNETAMDVRYENVSISEYSSQFLINLKELLLMRAERKLNIKLELERQFDESTPRANAFYHQILDLIFIPVGIIQMPIFDHELPDLLKFSKLGSTYGHELAHSLHPYINGVTLEDRSGNSIEFSNTVVNQRTRDNYAEKCACVEQQYGAFQVPLPPGYENTTLVMNGTFTLNENVADILGVQVAFDSFIENMGSSVPRVLPGLEKFTWQQIFFIASAQERCRSFVNDETEVRLLKEQLETDLHSPSSIRVLGAFSNNDEFAKAFNCPVGSRYNPEKKCKFFVPPTH
ncbi:endothelin-converting enzyme homolog isoform X2 [Folsomia candida]|nr:endothelin-converting enzyme homolog isoform X2 [Folsomia candida]